MSVTKVYAGLLSEKHYGENDYALFVGDDDEPLAERVQEDIDEHGSFLSVRYFVSDEPKTLEELETDLLKHLDGAGEAEYDDRYSDITGYLWTDEELNVGGHDLMDELKGQAGRFLWMEIGYSRRGAA